jgi:small subunit ribosomal protein S1
MNESFAELLEGTICDRQIKQGEILSATVVDINPDVVIVSAGLKSEAVIPVEQFFNSEGSIEVQIGDQVDVALDLVEDGYGETKLSRDKAKKAESWKSLETSYDEGKIVSGKVTSRVRGGFTVDIGYVRAFLPGSLVDSRPIKDPAEFEGNSYEFKVIKLDKKKDNVVVSRKAVVEQENSAERDELIKSIKEGSSIKGVVKNLTDYGAFVDLGGMDGLLHITDMAWKRVKHPSEIVQIGDELDVKVLRFDKELNRVSLGLKQFGSDPWTDVARRYALNSRFFGKVTNIADYGCFIELEEGIEGLVHVSEMDWTNKNVSPSKVVEVGMEAEVMVLEIDEERRRISLGLKQCKENPWKDFESSFSKGDKISGKIRSITDFGIFIGLDGGIDGLVHLSDLSWDDASGQDAVRNFKKGEEIETVILAIDAERERISLGIKQINEDPVRIFLAENPKGSIVKGKVSEVSKLGANIDLGNEVFGYLKTSEISRDHKDDARSILNVGDELEAKIINIDKKNRDISLSVKSKEEHDEQQAVKNYQSASDKGLEKGTSLGDLLKEKLVPED